MPLRRTERFPGAGSQSAWDPENGASRGTRTKVVV